ncbi:TonB-dependent receptor [Altererythrobacter soli]|uniref:TonB-dependent receptor n=1 Tax=Croceibacterium soli TaxID=1739690 RepID=A0A6I4UUK6_9SPHN|nr:TonB-dependent receptor [Croceibacterium soli]MXP41203.1 TonB-dependent receptor [Croceibacterium soli]
MSFSAAIKEQRPLYAKDNSLTLDARSRALANGFVLFPAGQFTNITSLNGPLVLDDGTEVGSDRIAIPRGYAGRDVDGLGPLVANAGQVSVGLSDDASGRYRSIFAQETAWSTNLNVRHQLSNRIDMLVDLSIFDTTSIGTDRAPYRSAFFFPDDEGNPFQQFVFAHIPSVGLRVKPSRFESQTFTVSSGLIYRLSKKWSGTLDYTFGRSTNRQRYTGTPLSNEFFIDVASGDIDVFRDLNKFPIDFSGYERPDWDILAGPYTTLQHTLTGRVSGEIARIWGRPVTMTALLEHRAEVAKKSETTIHSDLTTFPRRSQSVDSVYTELRLPLVDSSNGGSFIYEFDLQGALRFDRYRTTGGDPVNTIVGSPEPSDFSMSTSRKEAGSFTLAARWAPSADAAFRLSYSTGFLPPAIEQIGSLVSSYDFPIGPFDPVREEFVGTSGPFDYVTGGNRSLRPERSKSLSFGVVITPRVVEGLRLSVDYTQIKKRDEITILDPSLIFADEELYSDRIVREITGDGGPGRVTLLDTSLINALRARVKAIDVQADYSLETGVGKVSLRAVGSRSIGFKRQTGIGEQFRDRTGYIGGPLKWQANLGALWEISGLRVSWDSQFYSSYSVRNGADPESFDSDLNVVRQGAERVSSQTYHDLSATFGLNRVWRTLGNSEIAMGVQNIFDKKPPFRADINGYSTYGDPRLRRIFLVLRTSFE